ncbi:GNAT family N-acetyltransferase [Kineococcus sp. DHX-1]|uniref:GNAT family N-acetyltransferase n=1 Tax=Kineococcus sp. DHX-1 TaxID=3349638 RepID=UPI0036D3E9A9
MPTAAPMTFSTYDGAAPSKTWDAVTDLYVSTFSATPYEENPADLALIATWGPAQLAQHSGRMTIAHRDQDVAGFALVHALVHDEPWQTILTAMAEHPAASDALERPDRALIVHELAVDEQSRGQGIARTCLYEVLRDRNEEQVFIGVYDSATDAVDMYRRWGLTQVGAFRGPDSNVTLLVLARPLQALRTRLQPTPNKQT